MDNSHTSIKLARPEHELFQYDRFVTAEGKDVPVIEFSTEHLLPQKDDDHWRIAIIDRFGYVHSVPINKETVGIAFLIQQTEEKIRKLEDHEDPWCIYIFFNEKTQAGRVLRVEPEVDVDVFHVKKFLKHLDDETVRSEV